MQFFSLFLYFAIVAAEDVIPVPTISPTFKATVSLYPTNAATKTPIPAPVPSRLCYSNLTEIESLVNLKSPFIVETYILCPNTIYNMAVLDPISGDFVKGWKPIITKSNSIYQCGEDGKSSNNCVITGGNHHIIHQTKPSDEKKVNVVFKGITFEEASTSVFLMAAAGDISLIGCIVRNNQNAVVLPLLFCSTCARSLTTTVGMLDQGNFHGRLLKYYSDVMSNQKALETFKADAAKSYSRRLQSGEALETQSVIIDGCLFENNSLGPDRSVTVAGMIYIGTPDNQLTVKNSIFRNNNFADQATGRNGYAIFAAVGTKLNISDTCFPNNLFHGKGAVVIEGPAEDISTTNVYGNVDDKLTCSFASIGDGSCIEYDSASCTAVADFDEVSTTSVSSEDDMAKRDEALGKEENISGSTGATGNFSVSIGLSLVLMFFVSVGL